MRPTDDSAAGAPYHTVDISPARQIVVTFLDLSSWGHTIFGFLEVDVTAPRRCLEEHEARTGERLSFTAYLIFCLAQAVDADKTVQAYRQGRKKLFLFEDVDVGTMVEHRFPESGSGDQQPRENRAPIGHVIRRANRKTFLEIHREIRDLQARPPERKEMPPWMRMVLAAPGPLQKLLVRFVQSGMRRDPARKWVPMAGSVGVTAVGMFGSGGGWGLGPSDGHTLTMVVGGIARKPAVIPGSDRTARVREPHPGLRS